MAVDQWYIQTFFSKITPMNSIVENWLCTFSKTTVDAYRTDIRCFQQFMQKKTFERLRLQDIQQWSSSVSVTRRCLHATRSFLKFCFNQGHTQPVLGNLGRCVIVPRKSDIKRERIMSTEQATTAIDMADGNTKLMLKILFYLGLRISECRKLKRRDITLRRGSLHFQVLGKGWKQRTVIMGPKTSAAILPELPAVGYLFPGRNGCMTSVGAWKRVKKVMKHILPHASPHYFRHTFATICLRNGCDLATVSKQLGHSDAKTTSLYLHSEEKGASCFLES